MRIEDLRDIGYALFAMAKERRLSKGAGEVLGKGAGGDKTYAFDREAEEIILSGIEKLGEPVSFISEETGMCRGQRRDARGCLSQLRDQSCQR